MVGRIGATIGGVELRLLNQLRDANSAAAAGALRLASGQRIMSPADNPSGFIDLSQLQTQRGNVQRALANVTAGSSMASQVQLALDQIRTQLNTIRAKAVADEDGALDSDERAASQAAIDAAIKQIGVLVNTSINGRRLLDGSAAFEVSGADSAQIREVFPVSLGPNTSKTISGTVTSAATQATLTHVEASGLITSAATFTLEGSRGAANISVSIGDTLAEVAARINQESHLTGVTAGVEGGADLVFTSIDYGSREEVSITVNSGSFTDGMSVGTDATATINDRNLTGVGNRFAVADNGFLVTVEFQGGFLGAFTTLTIAGDALSYSFTTNPGRKSTLSIPGLQAAQLGGLSGTLDQLETGGALAGLGANAVAAVRVVDEALEKLTRIEGLVEGFADAAIDSSSALLNGLADKLDDAIEDVNLVDEDEEDLLKSKNYALASNALAGLSLLSQQRSSIIDLIQQIAGLK